MTLPVDAAVDRLPLDARGIGSLALTPTVSFRQFERTSLAPFVHRGLPCAWIRAIVRGWRVRAPGDESRTSQDYPFHVRSLRGVPSAASHSAPAERLQ
jgi:hypothetical protein